MKQDRSGDTKKSGDWPMPIIDQARCDGCGCCVLACPQGVITIRGGIAHLVRSPMCQYTGHCAQICPQQAIQLVFCVEETASIPQSN